MSTRNLPDLRGTKPTDEGFCGPRVTVTPSSDDGISVQVGHRFGETALTAEEWAELAASRGDEPYVLVERGGPHGPIGIPNYTYAEAMTAFTFYAAQDRARYLPDTGRRLLVMSQADYLEASKQWRQL